VKDLHAHPKGLAEGAGPERNDHEFLHVQRVLGMGSAVDDVHHRHGQLPCPDPTQIPIERKVLEICGRPSDRHRNGEDRIRPEFALVVGAVEPYHRVVDEGLIYDVESLQLRRNDFVNVLDRRQYALALEPGLVSVPQLKGLSFARRCTGGHYCARQYSALENHLRLNGWITPAVEHFSREHLVYG